MINISNILIYSKSFLNYLQLRSFNIIKNINIKNIYLDNIYIKNTYIKNFYIKVAYYTKNIYIDNIYSIDVIMRYTSDNVLIILY